MTAVAPGGGARRAGAAPRGVLVEASDITLADGLGRKRALYALKGGARAVRRRAGLGDGAWAGNLDGRAPG